MSELRVKKLSLLLKIHFKLCVLKDSFVCEHFKSSKCKNQVFQWIHFYDCFASARVASSTIGARLEVLGCSHLTQWATFG